MIPVFVNPVPQNFDQFLPLVSTDTISANRNNGPSIDDEPIVIELRLDTLTRTECHSVLEPMRGPDLVQPLNRCISGTVTDIPEVITGENGLCSHAFQFIDGKWRMAFTKASESLNQGDNNSFQSKENSDPHNTNNNTVLLFTRNGLGHTTEDIENKVAFKFPSSINDANNLPAKILFYTDGVKLACKGSPIINVLKEMEEKGVKIVLCSTCLDYFGLIDKVEVGVVVGMPDIIEAMQHADNVISL